MKLSRSWSLIVLACILSLPIWNHPVLAKTALSTRLLIPGPEPVRIKLPDASQYMEVSSLRALPEGTEIDPVSATAYTIICPDLSAHEMSSGDLLTCPEISFEVDFVIAVTPAWGVVPPDSRRGDGPKSEFASVQQFREAEEQITLSRVEGSIKTFLLVNLYAGQNPDIQAIQRFEDDLTARKDPIALRLLGYLYLQAGESRKAGITYYKALKLSQKQGDLEGQALAHHQLALLYQLKDVDEAVRHAQAALELYQDVGEASQLENVQKLLQELQK